MFNKMQLLVKIPSIFLNQQTVKPSTPSLVLEVGLRSSCGLTFYRCRITAFNTLTLFFFFFTERH